MITNITHNTKYKLQILLGDSAEIKLPLKIAIEFLNASSQLSSWTSKFVGWPQSVNFTLSCTGLLCQWLEAVRVTSDSEIPPLGDCKNFDTTKEESLVSSEGVTIKNIEFWQEFSAIMRKSYKSSKTFYIFGFSSPLFYFTILGLKKKKRKNWYC